MTRQEIRERFRQENPDITLRTIDDATLNLWIDEGQMDMASTCKFIVDDLTFTTSASVLSYDLSTLSDRFFTIDDKTSGIFYDDELLLQASAAQLANKDRKFKQNTTGTPKYWYRRKNIIYLDKYPQASKTLVIPCVLFTNDITSDSDIPFDSLAYLSPIHYGLVAYLSWNAKVKLGKKDEASLSFQKYQLYLEKGKQLIDANRLGTVYLSPVAGVYQPAGRR
jgi:hypothetical protein